MVLIILTVFGNAPAQKNEHYNSPLYAPRKYDPNQTGEQRFAARLTDRRDRAKDRNQLPPDAEFKDENGQTVKLGDYFGKKKPVILALVYYECPMLCNEVLNGLTGTLKGISFDAGEDFDVVAISFDARENDKAGSRAKTKKQVI